MNVKIKKFTPEYLDDIASSFSESFDEWNKKSASNYLMQTYSICPECCLIAVNHKNEVLGAIFCKISPHNKGKMLVIESLQILKKYRNQKIGTLLIKEVVKIAKKKKISNIGMLASNKTQYPMNWFINLGFKETGWVELVAKTNKIKFI